MAVTSAGPYAEREKKNLLTTSNKRYDNQNNKLMWQAAREEIPI